METSTLAQPNTAIDMTQLVGVIRISGGDPSAAARLSEATRDWIKKTGWDRHLRVFVEASHSSEVAFVPGGHQSNPEVRLTFREIPDFSRVRFRLEHWLYELM
jgi:phage host-nuclease inhibitor protein Gam